MGVFGLKMAAKRPKCTESKKKKKPLLVFLFRIRVQNFRNIRPVGSRISTANDDDGRTTPQTDYNSLSAFGR